MGWKRIMTNGVLLVSIASAAGALPPSLVLGGYFEGGSSSTLPSSAIYTDTRFQGVFGWRQALGSGSYCAVTSRASIAPYLTAVQGFVDSELLNVELGLPSGADSVIFDAGVNSSMMNQTGVGTYAQPAWSAEYRFARSDAGFQPSVGYQGGYLWEQLGSDDHLAQGLQIKLDQSSSVRLDTWAALHGGWELWTKQQAYDSSGAATGSLRQDWLLDLSAGARGFAGFSVDWTADLSGGVRLSDASLTASSASQLVLPGGSRLVVRGTGSLNVTPNRSISLGINGNVENDWYFARGGVNPDGAPAGVNLDALILGGGLKLDWTPDNAFYVVIQAGLNRTFANDPSVAQWSGTLSAGIEYSF